MGTRHKQTVIDKDGNIKIAQYGQWDGYPSGQGCDILEYLRNGNLKEYQKRLSALPLITKEQAEEVDKNENWTKEYPYLSRDCGARIHKMIEKGDVKFVSHIEEKEARQWCSGFYTIDFQKNEFTTEFDGKTITFKIDNLPSYERYLRETNTDED